jgi:mono/diheme cytochrome c family protein
VKTSLLLIAIPILLAACGGSAPPPAEPSAPPSAEAATPTAAADPSTASAATPASGPADGFAAQAAAGEELYGKHCAECHGKNGNDGKAPALVGLDAGALPLAPPPKAKFRKTNFKTVADVAAFVVKTMPPKAPGSLSTDEYYAILAFDLKANGIDLGDKKLDGALAATLDIPRK